MEGFEPDIQLVDKKTALLIWRDVGLDLEKLDIIRSRYGNSELS